MGYVAELQIKKTEQSFAISISQANQFKLHQYTEAKVYCGFNTDLL